MSVMRVLLPVLAAVGVAYAECPDGPTFTVQNSGDAGAFSSCATFSGTIAVATGTAEDLVFTGLKVVEGSLELKDNNAIKSLQAPDLLNVTDSITVTNIQNLNTLNFPKLVKVKTLTLTGLPNLYALGLDAGIEESDQIDIENTNIQALSGINVESIDTITIANNKFVTEISLNVTNVTSSLVLAENNPEVKISLPNLESASNTTFINCSSIDIPALKELSGTLNAVGNGFESIAAPSLTQLTGALAIVSNTELTNISFPVLKTITEDLSIQNNTKLGDINGFPKLEEIRGALNMYGNMTGAEFPALKNVRGAFNFQTSKVAQGVCDYFNGMKNVLHGTKTCKDDLANPGDGKGDQDNTTNGNKPSSASGLSARTGALGLAGLAAVLLL